MSKIADFLKAGCEVVTGPAPEPQLSARKTVMVGRRAVAFWRLWKWQGDGQGALHTDCGICMQAPRRSLFAVALKEPSSVKACQCEWLADCVASPSLTCRPFSSVRKNGGYSWGAAVVGGLSHMLTLEAVSVLSEEPAVSLPPTVRKGPVAQWGSAGFASRPHGQFLVSPGKVGVWTELPLPPFPLLWERLVVCRQRPPGFLGGGLFVGGRLSGLCLGEEWLRLMFTDGAAKSPSLVRGWDGVARGRGASIQLDRAVT